MKKRYIYIVTVVAIILAVIGGFIFFNMTKDYPITIDGIDINERPEKVVALSSNIVDIMVDNGYKDVLVGIPDDYTGDETFKDIAKVGTAQVPNINLIHEQNPSLLISATPLTQQHRMKLESNGTIVIYIKSSINADEFNNMTRDVILLMEGNNKYADKYNSYVENEENELKALYSKAKVTAGQTFAIIPQSNTVSTRDTVESVILSNVMGQNVTGEATNFDFTIEELKEANPEYLLVREGVDISLLKDFDAVKNNKVIYISFNGFEENNYDGVKKDINTILEKVYNVKNESDTEKPTEEKVEEETDANKEVK